jgi:hypothetical protein
MSELKECRKALDDALHSLREREVQILDLQREIVRVENIKGLWCKHHQTEES